MATEQMSSKINRFERNWKSLEIGFTWQRTSEKRKSAWTTLLIETECAMNSGEFCRFQFDTSRLFEILQRWICARCPIQLNCAFDVQCSTLKMEKLTLSHKNYFLFWTNFFGSSRIKWQRNFFICFQALNRWQRTFFFDCLVTAVCEYNTHLWLPIFEREKAMRRSYFHIVNAQNNRVSGLVD